MNEIGRSIHEPGGWPEKEWPSFEVSNDPNAFKLRARGQVLMSKLLEYENLIP